MTTIRRHVAPHPLGYEVDGFITSDPALAEAVAEELDRVDPMQCPHPLAQAVQIRSADNSALIWRLCAVCGDKIRATEPTIEVPVDRDTALADAVRAGKFPRDRLADWQAMWDEDPVNTARVVAALRTTASDAV